MTDKSIDLDQHRGSAAQKASDPCRLLAEVEANERALHLRQDELEFASGRGAGGRTGTKLPEGALSCTFFATTLAAQDPRRQKLIAAVLNDFERLAGNPSWYRKLQERTTWRKGN